MTAAPDFPTPLPAPTDDASQLLADLRTCGVAILRHAFDTDLIALVGQRLEAIAAAERSAGTAVLDDGTSSNGQPQRGANQRVLSLIDKDPVFVELVTTEILIDLAARLFAESYPYPEAVIDDLGLDRLLLSSVTANVANRGGQEMALHADQGFVPPSIDLPMIMNVVIPLVDFSAANGATRVIPGSHRGDPAALAGRPEEAAAQAVPVEVPAGAALLIDGRTWHGTGANRTARSRPAVLLNYCRPWVRPFEEHFTEPRQALAAAAVAQAAPGRPAPLADLLGYRRWFVYGQMAARRVGR